MPPWIALAACIIFVAFLFLLDVYRKPRISASLWIPYIWLLVLSSKPISTWIDYILGLGVRYDSYEQNLIEGNPVDRYFFLTLIILGLIVLIRRKISLKRILKGNWWIILFLLYCGLSTVWADYPYVSFKRWIKEIGNLIMILVILTDIDATEAVKTIVRRVACVLVPFSFLLIRYYPQLGRMFSSSGELMSTGVAGHKNSLGVLCMVIIVVYFWDYLWTRHKNRSRPGEKKRSFFFSGLLMALTFWLLFISNSATAVFGTFLGCAMILALNFPLIRNNVKHIGVLVFFSLIFFLVFQYLFNITGIIVGLLGRDMTLTGRTEIWNDLLTVKTNPFIGAGYSSFWSGDELDVIKQRYQFTLNSAHNGYLETYLNLGWIGLLLLIGTALSGYRKIRISLQHDFRFQELRLTLFTLALTANITEAYFKGLSLIWFVYLLVIMKNPRMTVLTKFKPNRIRL